MVRFLLPSADGHASGALREALAACRGYFVHAAVFSAFLNLLYLAPTLFMLQVYDRVIPTRGVPTLGMLVLIFLGAVATIGALDLVRTRLLVRAGTRLDQDLTGAIIDAQLRIGNLWGRARTSAILREFDGFRQTITGMGVLALFDIPWAPIYIFACYLLHPALAALAVVGAVLLSLLSWANEHATKEPLSIANQQAAVTHAAIDASLAASGVIGALGMREAIVRRHVRERTSSSQLAGDAAFLGVGYTSAIKALRLFLQSMALALGALLVIRGDMSGGAVFAASLLVSRALQPIELVNGAWKNIIQARNAYAQLVELFSARGEPRQSTRLPDPQGRLDAEGVTIVIPGRDRPVLHGVGLKLEPGESLGIIGPSGAGKSTLARVLAGAMPVSQGLVRIDGASLADWPEDQLGHAIGYVPQEPTLFRGTIKENIARFRTELAAVGSLDEAVVRAAQACGAHEMILALPAGYDTELGWGGSGLSSGQAQRIALARALFGDPALVIMDEPNANLDQEGDAALEAAIAALRAAKVTVVIVAHRLGILGSVDKLMLLRDGRVELLGNRAAVLSRLRPPGEKPAPVVAAVQK